MGSNLPIIKFQQLPVNYHVFKTANRLFNNMFRTVTCAKIVILMQELIPGAFSVRVRKIDAYPSMGAGILPLWRLCPTVRCVQDGGEKCLKTIRNNEIPKEEGTA